MTAGRVRHRSWQEIFVAAGLLVLALWLVWHARTFGTQARVLPLAAGIPLLALSAFNLVTVSTRGTADAEAPAALPSTGTPGADGSAADPDATEVGAAVVTSESGLTPALTFLAFASLVALFLLFGILVAALIYPVGVMRLYGQHSWTRSLMVACAISAVLYGASRALGVPLFEGWLFLEGFLPELPL